MAANVPAARRISGAVFAVVMVAVAAVLLYLVWLVQSPTSPFWALTEIGFVALVFGLAAFLSESLARDPSLLRATSWAFLTMGLIVVIATSVVYSDPSVSTIVRVVLVLVALLVIALIAIGSYWTSGQKVAVAAREEGRDEWRSRPPASAFDYVAARPPSVAPPSSAPPSGPTAPEPPGRP